MSLRLKLALILSLFAAAVFADDITVPTVKAGETFTMTADNTYFLDGLVFVEDGGVLEIQPGVVIKAIRNPTTGDTSSALIIARGGKIYANGTADAPIIMTSELDDLNDPDDFGPRERGFWGGLIVLGKATTNRGVEGQIEGIDSGETRGAYGGDDDHDSSGVIRYLSIRHGGDVLGAGDEINGLTMGAVGDGTIISHVEVYANLDDGYEWFGGTVNTKYLVAAFCADDAFDYDEGWRGKNQFWFVIQDSDNAGRIGEHDGGTVQETAEPYAKPYIYNATYIGPGVNALPSGDGSEAVYFRDNAGGIYSNCIITDYNGANNGKALTIEDLDSGEDSRARLEAGDLKLTNNIWWGFGNGSDAASIIDQDFVLTHFNDNNNVFANPLLRGISRVNDGRLDPRPSLGSMAVEGAWAPEGDFFSPVEYQGAFDPKTSLWTNGWTALWAYGHTADRSISHITAEGQGFQTTVRLHNKGSEAVQMALFPYDASGAALGRQMVSVPAGTTVNALVSELFEGKAVSHFSYADSKDCDITASYRRVAGPAASADLNGSLIAGTGFAFYQGEWDLVFDGLAVVNDGLEPSTITAIQKDASGNEIATGTIVTDLAPGAKSLQVFDGLFENIPGSLIEVHSTQPSSVVFLRGARIGDAAGFLYVTLPIVLN